MRKRQMCLGVMAGHIYANYLKKCLYMEMSNGLTIACIQALRANCAFYFFFLEHQIPVIEMTPEQIWIKFQFISAQFMNHEQFALLEPPRTSAEGTFVTVEKGWRSRLEKLREQKRL